jgi:hypothetical protein
MWADPTVSAPLRNVWVVAVKPNEGNRRIMEDAFVKELGLYGVNATPSYRDFPDALPDTNTVREHVLANGYDGVLVAARLPARTTVSETPAYMTTEARTAYSSWTGRYHTYYVDVVHEGSVETTTIIPHRVDVWASDGKGGHLIWTAEGRSIDPNSVSQVSREISDLIMYVRKRELDFQTLLHLWLKIGKPLMRHGRVILLVFMIQAI